MTFSVQHINHPLVGTNAAVAPVENVTYHFLDSDFPYTDPQDAPTVGPNGLKNIIIDKLPTSGVLKYNGNPVREGDPIAFADLQSATNPTGKLTFDPAPNTFGNPVPFIGFQLQDDGGTTPVGSVDLEPLNPDGTAPHTISLNVQHVHQAPTANNGTVGNVAPLVLENKPSFPFTAANFGFNDGNDGDSLKNVIITDVTGLNGTLTLPNGKVVVPPPQFPAVLGPNQVATPISIAANSLNQLLFTPASNTTGTTAFRFAVQDFGGTATVNASGVGGVAEGGSARARTPASSPRTRCRSSSPASTRRPMLKTRS